MRECSHDCEAPVEVLEWSGALVYGGKEEMLKLVELGLYIGKLSDILPKWCKTFLLRTYLILVVFAGVNGCSLKTAENLDCVKAIPFTG